VIILEAINQAVSRLYAYEKRDQEKAKGTMQMPDAPIEVDSPADCRAGNLVLLGLNGSDLGGVTRT